MYLFFLFSLFNSLIALATLDITPICSSAGPIPSIYEEGTVLARRISLCKFPLSKIANLIKFGD